MVIACDVNVVASVGGVRLDEVVRADEALGIACSHPSKGDAIEGQGTLEGSRTQ